MSHAVIGIFDSDFDAQDAVDDLIENGFERKSIRIDNKRDVNAPTEHHKIHEGGLARFFKTIFGDKSEDADRYVRVASGGAVVTVNTNSEDEAARAADILDNKGAINVNERATQYGYTPKSTTVDKDVITGSAAVSYSPSNPRTDDDGNDNTRSNTRREPDERSGPGVGSEPTGGDRSKSRIIEWQGEASARLREDRDNETKFW